MRKEIETENAIIEDTFLGIEDHGIFTYVIHLDYGGSGQGAGMISLDGYNEKTKKRTGWDGAVPMLRSILDVIGARSWEELKGKHVRVKHDWDHVYEIGHIIKDKWVVISKNGGKHNG